jgi:hypothetical protein
VHGAIGTTDEYDLGLYVNRALTLSAWMGNASEHRRRFGALSATAFAKAYPLMTTTEPFRYGVAQAQRLERDDRRRTSVRSCATTSRRTTRS